MTFNGGCTLRISSSAATKVSLVAATVHGKQFRDSVSLAPTTNPDGCAGTRNAKISISESQQATGNQFDFASSAPLK